MLCRRGAQVHGIGPAYAIPKCLKGVSMDFNDVDYWEINEAFAAQFLGVGRKLQEEHGWKVDLEKTNVNGSGISLGHPIGCTGLRIIVTMLYEMERRGLTVGGRLPVRGRRPLHGLPVDQGHLIPPPMVSDPTGALHPLVEIPKMPAASAAGIFRPAPPPPCNLARERLQ